MSKRSTGYYSSLHKDVIRQYFDLPLLQYFQKTKGGQLTYFGLPGAEGRDIRAWQGIFGRVVAVEKDVLQFRKMKRMLESQSPDITYVTYLGDVDRIILNSRPNRDVIDQNERPNHEKLNPQIIWDFDVVYLDYFGIREENKGIIRGSIEQRWRALKRLFETDRISDWSSWVLLLTAEARITDWEMRSVLQRYLVEVSSESSRESQEGIAFLLSESSHPEDEEVRLIHGATAMLVAHAASNAGLKTHPRGTILYQGAHDRRMVHLAFEFTPVRGPFGAPSNRVALLRAPLLRPTKSLVSPWFELLPEQCPGATRASARECLQFWGHAQLAEIVKPLP